MRRRPLALTLLLLLAAPATAAAADTEPGRVVVGFNPGAGPSARADVRADVGATVLATVAGPREQVLRIPGDPEAVVAQLERRPEVAYAEPDRRVRASWAPNDPLLSQQWALPATSTPMAWDGARGAGVLVGVADTGVDFGHADLGRFWTNAGERPGNGIDDDGDGRVDDVHGYDFVNGDGDPTDDQNHGTSVTGVIAATADNGTAIAGVAPEATVVEAKALDSSGSGYASDVALGVRYLADRGARVVNLSLGGPVRSDVLTSAIAEHPETLVVVAAGNEGADNDAPGAPGTWPCDDTAANVICVGASTRSETRASFSNWGAGSVDLMAPGEGILSTRRGGGTASVSGTSFSAPMVSGAAALLFGREPTASAADVRAALLSSADAVPAYRCVTVTGGRLNVQRALATVAPGSVPATVPPECGPAPSAAAPASTPAPVSSAPAPTPARPARPRPSPPRATCKVPQLKRLTAAQAGRRLRAAGCDVGTTRRRSSAAVRRGRIVASSPRAGAGTSRLVDVFVSRGPKRGG